MVPEPVALDPDPVIEAYKRDVDRTLLRENLKLTPEARVLKLQDFVRFTPRIREDGRRSRRGPDLMALAPGIGFGEYEVVAPSRDVMR